MSLRCTILGHKLKRKKWPTLEDYTDSTLYLFYVCESCREVVIKGITSKDKDYLATKLDGKYSLRMN